MPSVDPKITTQEATGIGAYGGGWSPATVLDISSATQRHFTLARETNVLHVYGDSDVYILFDADVTTKAALITANSTTNDLVLPAGLHSIPVPRGLYAAEKDAAQNLYIIYLHVLQVTSVASKKFRIVES